MPVIVATFGQWQDVSGSDDKTFRYPVTLINRDDIGTSRQSSKTESLRIKAIISGTLRTQWSLSNEADVIKVLFEIAKEHLVNELRSGKSTGNELEVIARGKSPCPYDVNLIEEPIGAVLNIDVQRRIGFI